MPGAQTALTAALTRRRLALAAAGAGAALIAGCGDDDEQESTSPATTDTPLDLLIDALREAIDRERLTRSTYQRAARFTRPRISLRLRAYADQDLEHVVALRELLDRAGAGPTQDDSRNQPPFVRDADSGLRESLLAAERMVDLHTNLLLEVAPADRRTISAILANHAQHAMLLREISGRPLRSETVPGAS